MKKITNTVIFLFLTGFILNGCQGGGCQKKETAPEGETITGEATQPKVEGADNLSTTLSKALCKRMTECAPGTLTEEECINQTTTALMEAQKTQPIKVSDSDLAACVAAIEKGSCEEVMGTEPPKGCEFLK